MKHNLLEIFLMEPENKYYADGKEVTGNYVVESEFDIIKYYEAKLAYIGELDANN